MTEILDPWTACASTAVIFCPRLISSSPLKTLIPASFKARGGGFTPQAQEHVVRTMF